MQRLGRRLRSVGAIALALSLVPVPLAAQSTNDWRLPGATVRPAPPGSQGPVDRDNPVVTTTVPSPSQTATPSPAPVATPSQSPVKGATAQATPPATRQVPQVIKPSPTASPSDAATYQAPATAATALPEPAPASIPTVTSPPPVAPVEVAKAGWYWPWIAGAAGLLALVFAGLWWRRRKDTAVPVVHFEPPVVRPKPVAPAPEPLVAAPAPPPPQPQIAAQLPEGLGIALEVRRMNASLMATSLNYVLTLTNHGAEPLSALAVEGDMVSAHASLPPEAQIANDNQRMEPRHSLVTLAPGESAEFTGVFMLPLTAVTPIRAGNAAYFVPLARLRVEASTSGGASLVQAHTWVVGELPEDPGAALKPFRLDLGPRTYSRVGQRAVK